MDHPRSAHRLVSLAELQAQRRFAAWIGKHEVLALWSGGRVHVYSGMCPHQGGPLAEGELTETSITCPWHGCTFRLGETGQGECVDLGTCRNVSGMRLKPIPFEVRDNDVYVEVAPGDRHAEEVR